MNMFKSSAIACVAAAVALCAAGAASATVLTTMVGGIGQGITPFGDVLPAGSTGNTFEFDFTTSKAWEALFAVQVQNGGSDPVQFEVDKFESGVYVPIAVSGDEMGAVIPANGKIFLAPGSYMVKTDLIGIPPNLTGSLDGSITLAAVPEPGTWALLVLGVGMIGFAFRRRAAGSPVAA